MKTLKIFQQIHSAWTDMRSLDSMDILASCRIQSSERCRQWIRSTLPVVRRSGWLAQGLGYAHWSQANACLSPACHAVRQGIPQSALAKEVCTGLSWYQFTISPAVLTKPWSVELSMIWQRCSILRRFSQAYKPRRPECDHSTPNFAAGCWISNNVASRRIICSKDCSGSRKLQPATRNILHCRGCSKCSLCALCLIKVSILNVSCSRR